MLVWCRYVCVYKPNASRRRTFFLAQKHAFVALTMKLSVKNIMIYHASFCQLTRLSWLEYWGRLSSLPGPIPSFPFRLMRWSNEFVIERVAFIKIVPPPRYWLRNSCLFPKTKTQHSLKGCFIEELCCYQNTDIIRKNYTCVLLNFVATNRHLCA